MFCHNGFIEAFYDGKIRKQIINKIDDDLLIDIKGNTDSEYIFYLLLTFIEKIKDVKEAIKETLLFLNDVSESYILSINICLLNKNNVYVTRYINKEDEVPPSLYYEKINDKIIISSEPLNKKKDIDTDEILTWKKIEKNKLLYIKNYEIVCTSLD